MDEMSWNRLIKLDAKKEMHRMILRYILVSFLLTICSSIIIIKHNNHSHHRYYKYD